MEVSEVILQVFSILFLGDPIYAYRSILAYPVIGPSKCSHINVVRQRQQPSRVAPRCFRYPYESR